MGAGIAAALRDAGLPVTLVERDDEALARGLANLRGIFDGAVKRGRLSEADAADRMAGVTATTDYAALADTDLVIEAVFEDLAVKRAVFDALGRACRPDAILATNTSYLDPRAIAEGLPNPSPLHRPPLLQPGQRDEAPRDRPHPGDRPRDARHRLRPRRAACARSPSRPASATASSATAS